MKVGSLCRRWWVMLAAVLAALAGCGGGAAVGGDAGDGRPFGVISLALTDAPACGYDEVVVTVEKVRLHQSASAGEGEGGWQELLVQPPRRVNLLDLNNGVLEELGQATLPAGHYTQLRLVLAENGGGNAPPANAVKPSGGSRVPLATPSGTQSGLKINVDIVVAPDQRADFVIDFDACKSVVRRGNSGQYNLKPVLTVVPRLSDAGLRVVGNVGTAPGAGTQVSLQKAGVPVKATAPAADGSFVLYPVPVGLYDLVVTSPGRATVVITGVPVITTAYTFVGSLAQAILPPSTMRTVGGRVTPASATVRALQSLTGGPTIEAAWAPVDADDGEFSFSLPMAAPVRAAYVAGPAVPVFTADTAATGRYTVEAAIPGAVKARTIDVTAPVPLLVFTLP